MNTQVMQRLASSSRLAPRAARSCLHPFRARLLSASASPHAAAAAESATSSVNADEIAHFSRLSSLWWDERGEFQFLHKMNPVRLQFVREKLVEIRREEDAAFEDEHNVLEGLDVLDVGCGGGLLSESLARMGANTLGIDASSSNVSIASLHASADPQLTSSPLSLSDTRRKRLAYEHTSVEALLAARGPAQFDAVCSMEVLEHVDNPAAFLRDCASLVKPGGHLFLSTIARTPLAYLLTIFAAEHVLRAVAPGTHTYSKYVLPSELLAFFRDHRSVMADGREGARWISRLYGGAPARTEAETRGMVYVPWNSEWVLVPRGVPGARLGEACNFLFWVRRPVE